MGGYKLTQLCTTALLVGTAWGLAVDGDTECTVHQLSAVLSNQHQLDGVGLHKSFICEFNDDGDSHEVLKIINVGDETQFEGAVSRIRVSAKERQRRVVDMSRVEDVHLLPISIREQPRRVIQGVKTMVVLHISGRDSQPPVTVTDMSGDIFTDALNPAKGYSECSGGKLKLTMYPNGFGVINGVVEVQLDKNVDGLDGFDVANDALVEAKRSNPGSTWPDAADHILFMLPRGVKFNAAGVAVVPGRLSWYHPEYLSQHGLLMHELGHNFGLFHSGKNGEEYGDTTDNMGTSRGGDDSPRACFNGAKSWDLGWYMDRHADIAPATAGGIFDLVSIDDYVKNRAKGNQKTVLRLTGDGEENLFLQFNRAKGVNIGVTGDRDLVTITGQPTRHEQSWQRGTLGPNGVFTKANWAGTGKTLHIQNCMRVTGTNNDYSRIKVQVHDRSSQPDTSCAVGKTEFRPSTLIQLKIAIRSWCNNANVDTFEKIHDLSKWNLELMTSMKGAFANLKKAGSEKNCQRNRGEWNPIGQWNVANVEDFTNTFKGSDIPKGIRLRWDVGNALNMRKMFMGVENWGGFGVSSWKPNKCVDFQAMFKNSKKFKQDLSGWTVKFGAKRKNMFQNVEGAFTAPS